MTYKEFLNKYHFRILQEDCDDILNQFDLVFTNDSDTFSLDEIHYICRFCVKNNLKFDISTKLLCHISNISEDDF